MRSILSMIWARLWGWLLIEPEPPMRYFGYCGSCRCEVPVVRIRDTDYTEYICWHCDTTI